MLMLNNLSTTLFLFFSLLNHLAEATFNDESLIFMVENIEKKRSIFLNESTAPTRAFDLWIGNTNNSVVSTIISTTDHGVTVLWYCDWHPTGKWLASVGRSSITGAIYDFSAAGSTLYHINPQNAIISSAADVFTTKWHPSGNYLAWAGALTGGINGKIILFNQATGLKSDLSTAFDIKTGGAATIYDLDWSPDGKYLTVGGTGVTSLNHVITYSFDGYALWQLPLATITASGEVRSVGWSPDGKYLAISGAYAGAGISNIRIYYFNEQTLTMNQIMGCNQEYPNLARSLHWHPTGKYIVVGGNRILNINHIAYAFNGLNLVITSSMHHGDLATGFITTRLKWSPDGAYLGSTSNDNFFRLFSFLDDTFLEIQSATQNWTADLNGLSWSKDGAFFAINGNINGAIKLAALKLTEPTDFILKKEKKELIKIKNMFTSTSATLPALYNTVLNTSAILDSTLNFSISSLTTVTSFLINGITGATQPSFNWHPSQNMLAISTMNTLALYVYNQISLGLINSISTSQPLATTSPSWDLKWSPRGDYLLSGGWRVYINSFDGYKFTSLSSKYDHLFNGIEWDKSGNFIFCCEQRTTPTTTVNDPGQLSAYYFDGTSLTKITSTGDLEYSNQMSINYNNRLIAKGGSTGKVNIYAFDPLSTDTLSFVQSLNELTNSCATMIFHPIQDILFVNTDTQIRAFSINGTFTTELLGCQISATGAQFLEFDHTGKYLLVSFSDKFIIFRFDGATLSEVIRYSSGADTLTGAKWSYDGKTIATMVDTGSTVFLRILKVNFNALTDSKPDLLQETSQCILYSLASKCSCQ
jgi:WD40 repeat protein